MRGTSFHVKRRPPNLKKSKKRKNAFARVLSPGLACRMPYFSSFRIEVENIGLKDCMLYYQIDCEEKKLPEFGREIERVSYEDGCKVYFKDGGFIICRFSGTEPLLRIFAEADNAGKAQASIDAFAKFLNL